MEDLFTAHAYTRLDTWADWLVLLLWFAGLVATFAITWWATRRTVLAIAYRLPSQVMGSVIVAAGNLAAAAGLLAISPMPLGFTLIAAVLALGLAAAGVGFSLVGYDNSDTQPAAPGPSGAKIVDLHRSEVEQRQRDLG